MTETGTPGFLVIRLSSLGDLVHTIPAVAALRQTFPGAKVDWVVEKRWAALIQMVRGVDEVIALDRPLPGQISCIRRLRRTPYGCVIDFQGLYKSALLAWLSGVPRRIGRNRQSAREPGAAAFYTDRVQPQGSHVAEMNLSLAHCAGARTGELQFPMRIPDHEVRTLKEKLSGESISDYVLLSPGGGWKSKCWPAERYGTLCAELWRRHGIRSLVNQGPGEEELARAVAGSAGQAMPVIVRPSLPELAAFCSQARLVVAADTGPLHLAAALGTRVVALFGPTNPDRNGPLPRGRVIRNTSAKGVGHQYGDYTRGNYTRGDANAPDMLSLSVEQVLAATEEEMSVRT